MKAPNTSHWTSDWASPVDQVVKNLPALQETWVRSLSQEDPQEKEMQPTPVFLPGKSHGQEKPSGLQSTRSQRVGCS